jgi:uncharacterized protein (TIGR03663 family)
VLVLLLRLYNLDARTIHIDEGMGLRWGQLMHDGLWRYSPYNAHGPIYFFFASFVYGLFGDNVVAGRAGIALVSVFWLSALLWMYWSQLRNPGRLLLLAGLGFSSGMVFFARNFIHEHLLILATVGALFAAEQWIRRRAAWAPATFIVFCVLMYATKETALLTWIAWGAAAVLLLLERKRAVHLLEMNWKSVALGVCAGVVLHMLLFTVFFQNPRAILDSVISLFRWSQRAQAMHVRPFPYFLELLALHEFPLVIGAIVLGCLLTIRKKWAPRLVFFALWTVFIVLEYSVISYKTPWCIPNLILPLGLFVAFAFDALWRVLEQKQKEIWFLLAVVLLLAGAFGAWLDSIDHPDRVGEHEYAYLQSDASLRRFIQTLRDLNTLYDGSKPMQVQRIGNTDELLYVLSKPYTAYDSTEQLRLGLPVYINYFHDDKDTLEKLKASGKNYIRSTYRYLRDWGNVVDLFVEEGLWNRYILEVAHEEILPGENPLYDYSN